MRLLRISEDDKILILAPHPDDECIGCGGLLNLYGEQCDIVVMTDGSRGDVNKPLETMKEIRRKEFEKTISYVDVNKYVFLDYPDGELIFHSDCMQQIDLRKYTKIFIPHHSEVHSDHKATFQYLIRAVRDSDLYDTEIYQYETRAVINDEVYCLDITSCIDEKLDMVMSYESQLVEYDYVSFAKSLARYHASKENVKNAYLEAYIKYDPIHREDAIDYEGKILTEYRIKNEILDLWLKIHIENKSISDYLRMKYNKVAIYGYGYFGRLLYKDIVQDGMEINFVIDQNADDLRDNEIKFIKPEAVEDTDLLIVSNLFDSEAIKRNMICAGYEEVVTLRDILLCIKNQK